MIDKIVKVNFEDYMVRCTAGKGMIRAFAVTDRGVVEAARKIHNTSPVVTAAMGRLMTAALIMGADQKNSEEIITIQIGCNGPVGGITVTSDKDGNVKGYVKNPNVIIPPNSLGKLDVAGALGDGVLTVIKDTGLKEPYIGQTILVSGEIAEDMAYYYATSEQIPSTVALGVLINKENTVRCAGGYVIQLMPGAPEELIDDLEKKIKALKSTTQMLDEGLSPEAILDLILKDYDPVIKERMPVRYYCNCNKSKVEKVLISVGKEELNKMIEEGEPVEMVCSFCGTKYEFSTDDVRRLLNEAK